MKRNTAFFAFSGVTGLCGSYDVFLGFGLAKELYSVSFADVLDESTSVGYQRPRSRRHSLDFRRYITGPSSSTIPLTFNLRRDTSAHWRIDRRSESGAAELIVDSNVPSLAQLDCQHRLGELGDVEIPLAFMAFIGLDLREEMAQFVTINSKARGLSSSLTDYHESTLLEDLAAEAPHLYIARKLNEDPQSPWYRMVRLGGENTSGLKRITSYRMLQKSVARFLKGAVDKDLGGVMDQYNVVRDFWRAVRRVFEHEWLDHRHHMITKGLGLYALTYLLIDIVMTMDVADMCEDRFVDVLQPLSGRVDWHSKGQFSAVGGQKGALEVYGILKQELRV